jgi:hypothetical protein
MLRVTLPAMMVLGAVGSRPDFFSPFHFMYLARRADGAVRNTRTVVLWVDIRLTTQSAVKFHSFVYLCCCKHMYNNNPLSKLLRS